MQELTRRRRRCLAALCAPVVLVAACSQEPAPEPETVPTAEQNSSTAPALPAHWPTLDPNEPLPTASNTQVDGQDSWSVAEATIQIIYTRNASLEPDYHASFVRAAGLMTSKLADEYGKGGGTVRTVQPWTEWLNEGASVAVETEPISDERPPETDTVSYQIVHVIEYPTSSEGRPLGKRTSSHYLTMRRDSKDDDWKVDELNIGARNEL